MTAASADRDAKRMDGNVVKKGIAASTTIYKDTMVMYDSSGNLTPMTDASGNVFAGIALEGGVGTTAGAVEIAIRRDGIFEMNLSGAGAGTCGDVLYATDDQTVKATAGDSTAVGRAVRYDTASMIFIDIGGYC